MRVPRVAAVGECMIELSVASADLAPGGGATLAYGGDTLNTAVYLARQGVATDYLTALGDDPYSAAMLALWRSEGVGTSAVPRRAGRVPGLYMIRTDTRGERSFHYWRDRAPARELFDGPEADDAAAALVGVDAVYFSGITLSLYGTAGRERFHAALGAAKAGGARIVFDGNFRPRGWPDRALARTVFARFLDLVDIALPTFDDEAMLWSDASPEVTVERMRAHGIAEIAVKNGEAGCLVADADTAVTVPVPQRRTPIDTTAAGDSFNAGYLAGRLAGLDATTAALRGHVLAAAVIGHKGALIPRTAMPGLPRLFEAPE
jgi:2-dehydro-3-deoxygluconokinase